MTEKKYIGYSVDDLIEDPGFISIVKNTNRKEEWEQFLELHYESKKIILEAREIILLFGTNDGTLSSEKKFRLWKNISNFNTGIRRKYKIDKIKIFAKVAASILLIVSLVSLFYLNSSRSVQEYQFSESQRQMNPETPLLVLSNGNQVQLEKDEPNITVLKNQNAIQIDNDSIVSNQPVTNKTTKETKFNEIIVPYGKKSQLVLSDGTKVWLNAGSQFAFPQEFEGEKREVFLDGEGYFEVAKNKSQPFVITAHKINVKVLGTKFNVSAYHSDNYIETTLLEGRVSVWENSKIFKNEIIMFPDQKATYSKIKKEIELKNEPNSKIHIAWVEGWYEFSNENLTQVFKKLERYYNVTFEYDQSTILKALPISGKLDVDDSLNEAMTILSGVAQIKYQIMKDKVIIIE